MEEDFEKRYPVKRHQYTQSVGKLLPHRISQVFRELGFETWLNPGQTNGVDLKAYDNEDNLVLVAEILNWSVGSLISDKRKTCIIENLEFYDCEEVVICTRFDNDYKLDDLSSYGISLIRLDYQILPRKYYKFFSEIGLIKYRKTDSKETKQHIKSKVIEYLQSSSIRILASTRTNPEITVADLQVHF